MSQKLYKALLQPAVRTYHQPSARFQWPEKPIQSQWAITHLLVVHSFQAGRGNVRTGDGTSGGPHCQILISVLGYIAQYGSPQVCVSKIVSNALFSRGASGGCLAPVGCSSRCFATIVPTMAEQCRIGLLLVLIYFLNSTQLISTTITELQYHVPGLGKKNL